MFKIISKWLHTDHLTAIRNKTNNEKGEAYVGEATKIVIAVVLGAALLAGLLLINNKTVLPRIEGQLRMWLFTAQIKYMDKETATALFDPYYNLYSDDDLTAFMAFKSLMQDSGLIDDSGHQTAEGDVFTAQMKAELNNAYPDGYTNEEESAFVKEWLINYAENEGIDTSVTAFEHEKQSFANELVYYSTISQEEYATIKAEALEYDNIILPETPYSTQEEWRTWLNTGEGMKLVEAQYIG